MTSDDSKIMCKCGWIGSQKDLVFSSCPKCRSKFVAFPPNQPSEWRPIETARDTFADTKSRLVWVPGIGCIYCVTWKEPGPYVEKSGWLIFGGGWTQDAQYATHWMPLPEPPVSESEAT